MRITYFDQLISRFLVRIKAPPSVLSLIILGVGLLIILTLVAPAIAQSGGTYDLLWSLADGNGGGFSQGGPYSLQGAIGQSHAGGMQGGDYSLSGGYLGGGEITVSPDFNVFLPLLNK